MVLFPIAIVWVGLVIYWAIRQALRRPDRRASDPVVVEAPDTAEERPEAPDSL
jgi:hypothetical protein